MNSFLDRIDTAERTIAAYEEYMSTLVDVDGIPHGFVPPDVATMTAKVGHKHHTVPRFLLKRWADGEQVQVYSRVNDLRQVRNIGDLAMRDFYTFIDLDGKKNSLMEHALSMVEGNAASVIGHVLSPYERAPQLTFAQRADLSHFLAFQLARTTRRRREGELQAEWFAKSMARGEFDEDRLAEITITPHQNEFLRLMPKVVDQLLPLIACRPVALVTLDRPGLFLSDEPVIVEAVEGEHHTADCFLTQGQVKAREAKSRRSYKKKGRRKRQVSRVVHMRPTATSGVGVADELMLPISPRAALIWGPLEGPGPNDDPVLREHLTAEHAEGFIEYVNDHQCRQALDWIVSTPGDEALMNREFEPIGPLMVVCDGPSAATSAVNAVPQRMRPSRLWTPDTSAS